MITFGVIIIGIAIAALAIYRWGRNSKTIDVLKSDVKTGEKANAVLEKQRDNRINSVADADRLWDSVKKD